MDDDRRDGVCCYMDVYTGVINLKQTTDQKIFVVQDKNTISGEIKNMKKQSIASLLALDEGAEIEFETVRPKDFRRPVEF